MINGHIYQDVQIKLDEISQANATIKAELIETNQSMQNMKMATTDLSEKFDDTRNDLQVEL